jgi:hypothetical protein
MAIFVFALLLIGLVLTAKEFNRLIEDPSIKKGLDDDQQTDSRK